MLLYLAQEGRGIGLLNKLRAYKLQEEGLDTVEANLGSACRPTCATTASARRSSSTSASRSIRILTNNPKKILGLEGYGLSVTDQIPIEHAPNPHNEAYLRTKRDAHGPHAAPPGPGARRGDDARRARAATATAREGERPASG